jgi:superfamily I DNA/RNA helicase
MRLLNLPNHPKGQPLLIYGPAGSGKTLLIIAKILDMIKNGEVDESTQILYMCENEEVQHYFRKEVEKNFRTSET